MMSPLHSLPGMVLTPWIRMMSPHLMVYCSSDMQDISYLIKYNTLPPSKIIQINRCTNNITFSNDKLKYNVLLYCYEMN